MTADDLTRRAIIAAHDADCSDRHCEYVHMPSLSKRETAIVEAWRADIAKIRQSERDRLLAHMPRMNEYARQQAGAYVEQLDRAEKAEAEVQRLSDWKESAMAVMSGLQDVGTELGLPLGESITGTLAAETAHRLRARAETAEAAIERVRALVPAVRSCSKVLALRLIRAIDGTETAHG